MARKSAEIAYESKWYRAQVMNGTARKPRVV